MQTFWQILWLSYHFTYCFDYKLANFLYINDLYIICGLFSNTSTSLVPHLLLSLKILQTLYMLMTSICLEFMIYMIFLCYFKIFMTIQCLFSPQCPWVIFHAFMFSGLLQKLTVMVSVPTLLSYCFSSYSLLNLLPTSCAKTTLRMPIWRTFSNFLLKKSLLKDISVILIFTPSQYPQKSPIKKICTSTFG